MIFNGLPICWPGSKTIWSVTVIPQYVFAVACTGSYQDSYLKTGSMGNADLVLQGLSYMTDNQVTLNIPTKKLTADALTVTRTGVITFAAFFVVLLPMGLLLTGVWVFLKRRHA